MRGDLDAVVVGSGPNGLAAAVTMAAAGLRVQVIEGAPTIGGGCRTEELTLPGFWHDVCSAGHPLAVASPFFRRFDLAARGVALAWPEVEFAQPLDGGRAAVVTRSVQDTAARLDADGRAYQRLLGPITEHLDKLLPSILAPLLRQPPAHPLAVADYGRRAILPASAVARRWRGQEARAIMAGAAAHAMMPLTAAPTAGIGLMLIALAHGVGWPVVAGGSARITDAMAAALIASGGAIETGRWVRSLAELPTAHAVLLDVSPRVLAQLAGDRLPSGYRAALRRFRYGAGVCKVDFALSGPVPWTNEDCRRAGTLHLGGPFEQVAAAEAEVAAGKHPLNPYVLVMQPGVADPSRARPAGRPCGPTVTCHRDPMSTWPAGSRRRSNALPPASATSSWPARSAPPPTRRPVTRTTSAATSASACRPSARPSCAQCPGGTPTGRQSGASTCAPRRPPRSPVSTAAAVSSPP